MTSLNKTKPVTNLSSIIIKIEHNKDYIELLLRNKKDKQLSVISLKMFYNTNLKTIKKWISNGDLYYRSKL